MYTRLIAFFYIKSSQYGDYLKTWDANNNHKEPVFYCFIIFMHVKKSGIKTEYVQYMFNNINIWHTACLTSR